MAKSKKKIDASPNQKKFSVKSLVTDGWENIITGIGTSRDKRTGGRILRSRGVTNDQNILEILYDQDYLAGRIVDLPAQEIYREWIDLKASDADGQTDVDTSSLIMQAMDDLGARSEFAEAESWARLYGGALILLGIDDGGDQEDPVNFVNIKSLDWITTIDKHDVTVEEYYEDPAEEKFGMPRLYRMTSSSLADQKLTVGILIHESRTIRFQGQRVSRRRRHQNQGWDNSVLERYYDVIRDFQGASGGIMNLLQDFSQGVFRIKDLAKALAEDNDGLVIKRLKLLDMSRSIARAIPLDADAESFERTGANVSGMADLYDRMMMNVSAASGIPVTLLFGRSPAGENATGESDIRLFYDHIKSLQETSARRRLEYFISILLASKDGPTSGVVPSSWSFSWNPLFQETSKEKAETRKLVAEADKIYIENKVLLPQEVAENRFGGDMYSPDTSLDYNLRKEKTELDEKLLELELSSASEVNKADAINYRTDEKDFCSSCVHVDGAICGRWIFQVDKGHRCDDFEKGKSLLVIDERQTPKEKFVRIKRGRNY